MARATLTKELYCEVKDEPGLLGRITISMAMEGVYIVHMSADSVGGTGILHLITKDNAKAKKAISNFIPKIEEREVLVVEFENKVGTLAPVAKILGQNDILIKQVFGTSGDGFKITGVFNTSNNTKAADLINKDSGSLGI